MEKLKPLVDQLVNLIQNGVDFIKGQIPDVALQILKFKAAEAWLQIGIWTLLGGLSIWLFSHFCGKLRKSNEEIYIPATIFSGLAVAVYLFAGVACTYSAISTLLMINYAPKLFLLEYLRTFLK